MSVVRVCVLPCCVVLRYVADQGIPVQVRNRWVLQNQISLSLSLSVCVCVRASPSSLLGLARPANRLASHIVLTHNQNDLGKKVIRVDS
jgi:hypothetical protein